MNIDPLDNLVSPALLAARLGVRKVWLERAAESGSIPGIKLDRGWMFDPAAVMAAIKARAAYVPGQVQTPPTLVVLADFAMTTWMTLPRVRALVDAGILPHFKFGRRILVDPEVAHAVLEGRVQMSTKGEAESWLGYEPPGLPPEKSASRKKPRIDLSHLGPKLPPISEEDDDATRG